MSGTVFGREGALSAALERLAGGLSRRLLPPLDQLASRPPISVIIPVYGAGEALERCVGSIRRAHEVDDEPELILVDDHSDAATTRICEALARGWPRTRVLRNERNLGFVGTVNRGMRATTAHHDVLLLNSDTVVSRGWLRGLSVTAHLEPSVGTVCPLSNAAGVFSTPVAYEDRPLPDGFDVEMCQRVLSVVAPRLDERVPTTSGFCMLIKRVVLERVGVFDSRLFLRGYGEENDFNERAAVAGFTHVVDDGRFIYHERAASFGAGKQRLKEQNSRILKSLHPEHIARTKAWLSESRLDEARRPYGALIEALTEASADERRRFFEAPEQVTVRFSPEASIGAWTSEERRVSVWPAGAEAWSVDLFGLARADVPECTVEALAFTLGRRFAPVRFEAEALGERGRDAVHRAARALAGLRTGSRPAHDS